MFGTKRRHYKLLPKCCIFWMFLQFFFYFWWRARRFVGSEGELKEITLCLVCFTVIQSGLIHFCLAERANASSCCIFFELHLVLLNIQAQFFSSATVDIFVSNWLFPLRQRQLSEMSTWISVWPRGGVSLWWATSHLSYWHTCMCVSVFVSMSPCTLTHTLLYVCVCVTVRQMVKYESRLGGTTPAGTPWVCLPPPPPSIFHPVFSVSPASPLFLLHLSRVCVCECVMGWRGWAPCDTWQRWARIRDVPAGEGGEAE